jgi:micrococcal nuclease
MNVLIKHHFFRNLWRKGGVLSPHKGSFRAGTDRSAVLIALFAFILAFSNSLIEAQANSLPTTATVTYVIDGDSFVAHFADGLNRGVRLIGVNAPEMTDERENVRYWAFLAKRFAVHQLEGRNIKLEYDWNNLDKYGRVLAYVRSGDGELFNELIIRQGFAYIFLLYPFRKDYQESFRSAQQEAVRQSRGLWEKEPPTEIGLSEVQSHLGEYIAVRFTCATVKDGERYIFINPENGELQILISKESGLLLPTAAQFKNKVIAVAGLLEKGKRQPRIYVLFQRQLSLGKF